MLGLITLLLIGLLVIFATLAMLCAFSAKRPPRHATGWALAHDAPISPASHNIEFEEWILDRPGGVRLPVWDVPGTNPDAPCLVMLHGWSRSKLTWLVRLDWWRARASRLVIPDLRGHGEATPNGSTLGDDDVDDVLALLERIDATNVVLLGRSMGSVVAIKAAAQSKEHTVAGVIAVAPYEKLADTIRARLKLQSLPATPIVELTMSLLRAFGIRDTSTIAAAATLRMPLLIVQGGKDPVSSPESARAIAEAHEKTRLVMVDQAGHGDHWDLEGDRLDDEVERFLADVSSNPKT